MLRHTLTVASITLLLSACGSHAAMAPKVAAKAEPAKVTKKTAETPKLDAEPVAEAAPTPASSTRKLGDFHVYEYKGAFSKEPISLTEQVVAKEDGNLVVDFVLQEGSHMSALRVRMSPTDEVLKVSRITSDGEIEGTRADYDALMKKTAFTPDSNDQALGTEHTACLVGTEQVECDVTTYGVTIGRRQATMSITRSSQVPGRDIGGDVVAKDGKVLYSARLVERGNQPPVVESFAKLEPFVPTSP